MGFFGCDRRDNSIRVLGICTVSFRFGESPCPCPYLFPCPWARLRRWLCQRLCTSSRIQWHNLEKAAPAECSEDSQKPLIQAPACSPAGEFGLYLSTQLPMPMLTPMPAPIPELSSSKRLREVEACQRPRTASVIVFVSRDVDAFANGCAHAHGKYLSMPSLVPMPMPMLISLAIGLIRPLDTQSLGMRFLI